MGPSGAIKLINTAESDPGTPAASLFPAAAKANTSIFYDSNGRARNVSEVYDRLTRDKDIGADARAAVAALEGAPQRVASAGASRPLVHQPADAVVNYRSPAQGGAGPLTFALSGGAVAASRPTAPPS